MQNRGLVISRLSRGGGQFPLCPCNQSTGDGRLFAGHFAVGDTHSTRAHRRYIIEEDALAEMNDFRCPLKGK